MTIIILRFDNVLHPMRELREWLEARRLKARPRERHGTIDITGRGAKAVLEAMQAGNFPDNLLSATYSGTGKSVHAKTLRGPAYARWRRRLATSKGRTTRLNALPHELGEHYWHLMTHPDYSRED